MDGGLRFKGRHLVAARDQAEGTSRQGESWPRWSETRAGSPKIRVRLGERDSGCFTEFWG